MGLIADLADRIRVRNAAPIFSPNIGQYGQGGGTNADYVRYARAYGTNEIVFACIDLLADSASEPQIIGKRYRREAPRLAMRAELNALVAKGLSYREADQRMIRNGFYEAMPNHPLVNLLNNPNPITSRGQFWGTVVMDRYIAGNSFALKSRYTSGTLKGAVAELWRLRPDRVKIIPKVGGIEAYEYNTGSEKIRYAPDDVLHFKERNPLNDFYGFSPIAVIYERLAIEENMRGFLRQFFERGGAGPGAVLSVKQSLKQEQKDALRDRIDREFGGAASGAFKTIIIDANEHSYTQLGLNRGLRDALPTEIDSSLEARIAMVFRIPASIIGTRIGMESSSYANKRQDWQVFWDLTMVPLLSDMDDVLNLSLIPEFGRIDEVGFDFSDIKALQEDVDKIHERHRKNVAAGLETWEEGREAIGYDPEITDGTLILPSNMTPISISRLEVTADEEPPAPAPQQIAAPMEPMNIVAEVYCPKCGRWVGRNMNVGATAYCPKDKEVAVIMPNESKVISVNIIRDEEGRVAQLVSGE